MTTLKRLWSMWKTVGRLIGDIVGRIILTVFHFTIFVPFALITRLQDPLRLKQDQWLSFWADRQPSQPDIAEARRLA